MNENINQNLDIKDLEGEIWKPIENYEGLYEISNLGRIKSFHKKTQKMRPSRIIILKQKTTYQNYQTIGLVKDKYIQKYYFVHRLIAQAFISNPNGYPQINHKNGIRNDNRIENLEWSTQKQNIQHAWKTGLAKQHPNKLNNNQVLSIRNKYASGSYSYRGLAKEYGLNHKTLIQIVKKLIWKHI